MSVLRTSSHHSLGTHAVSVRTRSSANAATGVFVIESLARSDGGIEHEGHQYLCPSCLAETSYSTVSLPVRCHSAFMVAIAPSTADCRRCASGTGDDIGFATLDGIEKLGKVSLGLRGLNFAHAKAPLV
jgi:hypothetical protein